MKKIIYGLLATISGIVLLFSYRTSLGEDVSTSAAASTDQSGTTSMSGGSTSSEDESDESDEESDESDDDDESASAGAGTSSGSASSSTTGALSDGTFTGGAVDTRFGPVQVQITVSGGEITSVDVPQYPDSNPRDRQINERALPQLISETLSAQSAGIHMVSGATYTSDGYLQSLQSAIDQAAQ